MFAYQDFSRIHALAWIARLGLDQKKTDGVRSFEAVEVEAIGWHPLDTQPIDDPSYVGFLETLRRAPH